MDVTLTAETGRPTGSSRARRLRAEGKVPAVSIMSSMRTHVRPSTSPTTSRASTEFLRPFTRRLCTMARSACSIWA
jgi:hypothetical protein